MDLLVFLIDGKLVAKKSTVASDPFESALFDGCAPLFDKDSDCNVEILEEC